MPTAFQIIDQWFRRLCNSLSLVFLPGIAGLFFIDLNTNLFRGEFGITDFVNFNALVVYYVEKLDLSQQQTILYTVVMALLVYAFGYFLHSSSKFFAGPRRFRSWFKVADTESTPHLELPPSALIFLQVKEGDLIPGAGEDACRTLVISSGITSSLPSLERRIGFYRAMGYLFSLMVLLDLCLFLVSFDFLDIIIKASIVIANLTFAFLFFKGQEECGNKWKETLSAETLVAVALLRKS
jgi:hypothetical protein